uniref:Mitochondrial amidoxime reducing component 2 n=1 Tax=Sphenodon punctatus TaxID=8508 RepID=A0A8D0GKH4_SPHPU
MALLALAAISARMGGRLHCACAVWLSLPEYACRACKDTGLDDSIYHYESLSNIIVCIACKERGLHVLNYRFLTFILLFGLDIQGRDCGDEAAQWITTFLNTQALLVHFEPDMAYATRPIAYPDCSPIMILSEASLEDLNTHLEKKVTIHNFRPNILVADCGAYEEVKNVKIYLKTHSACHCRCILTTVDPDTGIIDRKEPLETLKSYRQCDPSEKHLYKSHPLFGWYFGIGKTGTIQVGDPVYKIIQ